MTMDPLTKLSEILGNADSMAFRVAEELDGLPGKTLIITRNPEPKDEPPLVRGGKRAHAFTELAGFIDYLKKYGQKGQVMVLVDVRHGVIHGVLSEDEKKERERICYQPVETVEWKQLRSSLDGRMNAKEFARLIRHMRRNIVSENVDELRLLASQLTVSCSVTEHTGTGLKGPKVFGLVVKLEAKGGDSKQVEIPEEFTLSCRPFIDNPDPTDIEVFVDITADQSGKVFFELECPDAERIFQVVFEQRLNELKEGLKDFALVSYGGVVYERWDTPKDLR